MDNLSLHVHSGKLAINNSNSNIYKAWDLPVRLFHWINFLCVLTLSILGLMMLNMAAIGISSIEAKTGLKTLHVLVGYVFAANLLFRILWGFIGSQRARWKALLPGKNFKAELKAYKASATAGETQTFIGHNPKGRLSVLLFFLLMTVMMVTGLIRAGTDIYYPPFGTVAANFVVAEGGDASQIRAHDPSGTDATQLKALNDFKEPIGDIHMYIAYVLWLLVLIHIIAVLRVESSGNATLVSAMFSGRKHLSRPPSDE